MGPESFVLQVSDASEHAIQVRALMSAADSNSALDLRCEVREKLLEFVQKNYPQCLPRNRNELPEIQARVVPADGNRNVGGCNRVRRLAEGENGGRKGVGTSF